MRLDQIVQVALGQIVGRLVWQAAIATVLAVCAIVAVYHFSVSAVLALERLYTPVAAQLIMGGIYAAISLIALIALWVQKNRSHRAVAVDKPLGSPRQLQLVMLAEAVMLGYQLARKTSRAR